MTTSSLPPLPAYIRIHDHKPLTPIRADIRIHDKKINSLLPYRTSIRIQDTHLTTSTPSRYPNPWPKAHYHPIIPILSRIHDPMLNRMDSSFISGEHCCEKEKTLLFVMHVYTFTKQNCSHQITTQYHDIFYWINVGAIYELMTSEWHSFLMQWHVVEEMLCIFNTMVVWTVKWC